MAMGGQEKSRGWVAGVDVCFGGGGWVFFGQVGGCWLKGCAGSFARRRAPASPFLEVPSHLRSPLLVPLHVPCTSIK